MSRKLIRLGFQMLGRNRAHRQDIWPGMQIDQASGAVRWRGAPLLTLEPATDLIPAGKPLIAVVGSGPSLAGQNVQALGDHSAILCNGAILLADRIRPLAAAIEDERFVFRHHKMIAALPPDVPLLLSPAALRALAHHHPASLRDRRVALIDNLEKPLGRNRTPLSDPSLHAITRQNDHAALSLDPSRGFIIIGTVAFSALQFALAAQPQRIVLAGIDLGNAHQPRFYEQTDRAPSGLAKGLPRILAGFDLARHTAQDQGILIECASPISALLDIGYAQCEL